MPNFVGRPSKPSDRSQHALADQPPAVPAGPSLSAGNSGLGLLADSPADATPASANTALSSSESFADALQHLASPPSPHLGSPSLVNPAPLLIPPLGQAPEGSSPAFDGRP